MPKLGLESEGFKPIIVVDKVRNSYIYKNCEISIDKVENLGNYIELEYKGESDNVAEIQNLVGKILEEIGASVGEMDHKGYAYNLLKLKLKNKENIKNDKF